MSGLSEILEGNWGDYCIKRNVHVISRDGKQKQYDIFTFERLGLADQNPYLKPGDTVLISQAERVVEIAGEVKS